MSSLPSQPPSSICHFRSCAQFLSSTSLHPCCPPLSFSTLSSSHHANVTTAFRVVPQTGHINNTRHHGNSTVSKGFFSLVLLGSTLPKPTVSHSLASGHLFGPSTECFCNHLRLRLPRLELCFLARGCALMMCPMRSCILRRSTLRNNTFEFNHAFFLASHNLISLSWHGM